MLYTSRDIIQMARSDCAEQDSFQNQPRYDIVALKKLTSNTSGFRCIGCLVAGGWVCLLRVRNGKWFSSADGCLSPIISVSSKSSPSSHHAPSLSIPFSLALPITYFCDIINWTLFLPSAPETISLLGLVSLSLSPKRLMPVSMVSPKVYHLA